MRSREKPDARGDRRPGLHRAAAPDRPRALPQPRVVEDPAAVEELLRSQAARRSSRDQLVPQQPRLRRRLTEGRRTGRRRRGRSRGPRPGRRCPGAGRGRPGLRPGAPGRRAVAGRPIARRQAAQRHPRPPGHQPGGDPAGADGIGHRPRCDARRPRRRAALARRAPAHPRLALHRAGHRAAGRRLGVGGRRRAGRGRPHRGRAGAAHAAGRRAGGDRVLVEGGRAAATVGRPAGRRRRRPALRPARAAAPPTWSWRCGPRPRRSPAPGPPTGRCCCCPTGWPPRAPTGQRRLGAGPHPGPAAGAGPVRGGGGDGVLRGAGGGRRRAGRGVAPAESGARRRPGAGLSAPVDHRVVAADTRGRAGASGKKTMIDSVDGVRRHIQGNGAGQDGGPSRRTPPVSGAQRIPPRPRMPRCAPGARTTSIHAQGFAGRRPAGRRRPPRSRGRRSARAGSRRPRPGGRRCAGSAAGRTGARPAPRRARRAVRRRSRSPRRRGARGGRRSGHRRRRSPPGSRAARAVAGLLGRPPPRPSVVPVPGEASRPTISTTWRSGPLRARPGRPAVLACLVRRQQLAGAHVGGELVGGRPQASAMRSCSDAAGGRARRPGPPARARDAVRRPRLAEVQGRVPPGRALVGDREERDRGSGQGAEAGRVHGAPIRSSASTRVSAAPRSALTPERRRCTGSSPVASSRPSWATARLAASSSTSPERVTTRWSSSRWASQSGSPITTAADADAGDGGRDSGSHGERGGCGSGGSGGSGGQCVAGMPIGFMATPPRVGPAS